MTRPSTRAPQVDIDESDLEAVRAALLGRIENERGLRARLRDLPTRVRRALLVAWTLGLILLGWPGWRSWTLGFGAAALALGWLSLRPLHRPPLARSLELGVLTTTLGSAVVTSVFGSGPELSVTTHLGCFVPGMAVALGILAVWWLLSRGTIGFYALAGAASGGMAANAFLSARCPSTNPEHLVMAHLSILVLAFLAGWAGTRLRRA